MFVSIFFTFFLKISFYLIFSARLINGKVITKMEMLYDLDNEIEKSFTVGVKNVLSVMNYINVKCK